MTGTTNLCWKKGGSGMLVASFVGTNREFREWLAAGMPANVNVVSLEGYRRKRKNRSRRAARAKLFKPSIA
jgi:hypothetical protein